MLIEVIQRRPAQRTVLTIYASGFGFQLMTNILISLYITTRCRRNLLITDFTAMLRKVFQQRFICQKTFW